MGYTEAIRQQAAALEYWRSPRGLRHAAELIPLLGVEGDPAFWQENFARMIGDAAPFFVSAPICDLLAEAAKTLPPFVLAERHLVVPDGWVYFERPIPLYGKEKLRALLWSFAHDGHGHGGIVSAPFIDEGDLRLPLMGGFAASRFGEAVPFDGLLGNGHPDDAGDGAVINRVLSTLMLFLQDRILVSPAREVLNRQARRRLADVLNDVPAVRVVELRRRDYDHEGSAHPAPVEWSCRWLVRGHWRNHYYPATQEHRPMWITAHVKGPDDKPLRVAEKVAYEVVR